MLRVADVMTTKLTTLHPADSLKTAREIMYKARIRHLPVLSSGGGFVGLLTQRDLLRSTISHFADVGPEEREHIEAGIPVSEAMASEVLTIPPDMLLADAGELMLAHKFGCLPVLEHGQLRGILTESDFVKICLVFMAQSGQKQDSEAAQQ
ncbi:CBS domain-containing protein [Desulfovibrio sp. OttesenSCG-928-A18]|nr:CBS domain-containing protein [Desulfovibrio sp. OttesenSCG-928-A18]